MKKDRDITDMLKSLSGKGRFRGANYGKLSALFDRAEFPVPPLEVGTELARIRAAAARERAKKRSVFSLELLRESPLYVAGFAAAVLLLVMVLFYRFSGLEERQGRTVCILAYGNVLLLRDGGSSPLHSGFTVRSGDTVLTGAKSFADFLHGDAVRVRVKEKTRFRLDSLLGDGKGVFVFSAEIGEGSSLLNFRKFSRGDSATVKTPTSVAGVRGTSFGVAVAEDKSTRFEVAEGKISVRPRLKLREELAERGDVLELLNRLEGRLEESSAVVGPREICEVDGKAQERLLATVERAAEKGARLEGEWITSEEIDNLARAAAAPRVYAGAPDRKTAMMSELRDFSVRAPSAKRAPERLTVDITAEPDTARIFVDGSDLGTGKASFEATPGEHSVAAEAPGFERRDLTVNFGKENRALHLRLERPAAPGFNYGVWMSSVRPSHLLADGQLPLFISVDDKGTVEALANRRLQWRYNTGSVVSSRPVRDGGRLYLSTADESIICLSLLDGRLIWKTKIKGGLHFGSRVVPAGEYLYAGSSSGNLYKLHRSGAVAWELKLPGAVYSTPAVAGNLVFVPVQDGNIYGIDGNLRVMVMTLNAGRMVGASPVVRGTLLYLATFSGEVICYDYRGGEMKWRLKTGKTIITTPVLDGDHLYVNTADGYVYKITTRGEQVWRVALGGVVESDPVLLGSDLYVLSRQVFHVLDGESGVMKWSFVLPSEAATNIAMSGNFVYFGVAGKGIINVRK
jgi:outer membrane protein assembly factor BamB